MDCHSEKLQYTNSYGFSLSQTLSIFHLQGSKFCPCLSDSQTESIEVIPKDTCRQKRSKNPQNSLYQTTEGHKHSLSSLYSTFIF